ncbi:MAG: hypothetical protein ACRDG6_10415 [Candidatus Limnocylindria bacterium]
MGTLRYRPEIGWLLQSAMLIFVITVLIGVANGTKVFGTLDRAVLLTHVHAGTLGWITLGVAAACLWIFGGTAPRAANEGIVRGVSVALAVAVLLYIGAFWSGNFVARAVLSVPVLAAIVFLLGWSIVEARRIGPGLLSVPQLSAIAGLTSLVIGSILGVYAQFAFARGEQFNPMNVIGGHVTAQVIGFLLLLGMGLIEYWHRRDATPASWAGRIQVGLLFFGALAIAVGFVLGQAQAAGGAILLEIPALVIFIVRVGWSAVRSSLMRAGSARHVAAAVPFLVFNVGSIIYLILALFVLNIYKDFSEVPTSVAVTLDHALFVGVMTNLNFALLFELTADRRTVLPWADHLIFWGLNAGVAAFIAVLLANVTFFERFTAPVMGLAILLALVTFALRMYVPASTTRVPAAA